LGGEAAAGEGRGEVVQKGSVGKGHYCYEAAYLAGLSNELRPSNIHERNPGAQGEEKEKKGPKKAGEWGFFKVRGGYRDLKGRDSRQTPPITPHCQKLKIKPNMEKKGEKRKSKE